MVIYEGIFFDDEEAAFLKMFEESPLAREVKNFHCTFKYKPDHDELFDDIVGNEVEVMVVGYGCNGNNSGFQLLLPEWVQSNYINYDVKYPSFLVTPHITTSLADNARAVDTKHLHFRPFVVPFFIKGRLGYFVQDEKKSFVSFEKVDRCKKKTLKLK